MDKIALIKAEIERRLKEYWEICFHDVKAYNEDSNVRELKELLSFLSTLESKKLIELEEEIGQQHPKFNLDRLREIAVPPKEEDVKKAEERRKERAISCNQLEEEIAGMYQALFGTDVINRKEMLYLDTFEAIARHFAQWGAERQKEQMLKEAVEARIYGYDDGSFELIASWLDMPKNSIYKDGQNVRIIIVKEENK